MDVNEIELLSVGVDIGSSTSHLVFSNLLLARDELAPSRRFLIQERKVVYEGRIVDTPLLDSDTVDIARLTDFLQEEYRRAGVKPADVDTGAVIITGETAKKSNAALIAEALSGEAGKFVAATAGPHFESLIAAMGSGAKDRSGACSKTILSCDIGGGTANIAVSRNGRVVGTSCVAVGGRLIALDGKGKIRRLTEPARRVMESLGLKYAVGDRLPANDMERIAQTLAEVLVEVITGPATSPLARQLMVTADLDWKQGIDEIAFSGGVGELIYGGNGRHYDIGKQLADKIIASMPRLNTPVIEPVNKIRATVIGAGAHSLSISGSSGFMDERLTFPMKNIPVVTVDVQQSRLSTAHVVSRIRAAFRRFDLEEGDEVVALYFRDPVTNTYSKLELFAGAVETALPRSIAKGMPIILIFDTDIACGVGNVIRRETGLKTNLLTLDELDLRDGDWIDIGQPLVGSQVFPVTVKSLVFHSENGTCLPAGALPPQQSEIVPGR